jgi:hypothetical protein
MTDMSPFHFRPVAVFALLAAAGLLLSAPLRAADGDGAPVFRRPALLTSAGQSSDIVIVKALVNTQLKMDFVVKPVAQPADLAGIRSLAVVVGASAKGLGAAGLDMEKETARCRALLQAAREQKIPILVLHTGGEGRRGKTSNDLIALAVPEADTVIVVAGGNRDKLFDSLAAKRKVPVVEVDKLAAAGAAVKALFKE